MLERNLALFKAAIELIKDNRCSWNEAPEMVVEIWKRIEAFSAKNVPPTCIEEIEWTVRAYNALKSHDIQTLEKLSNLSIAEIRKWKNVGSRTIAEIELGLASKGMQLRSR